MKNLFSRSAILMAFALCSLNSVAAGLLTPVNASLPELQIKSQHVNVVIEDGYAVTYVDQVFHNPHAQDLEAIYSFPVPEKAAVGEFSYWIDGKPVSAEVLEKKQARQVYEQEKSQGRETALVEKDGYRSFDINVFPVRANQDVQTRLVYLQAAHVDSGIGRYVYPLEEGGVDEEKNAFWSWNEAVTEAFSFQIELRSSYPIDGLRFPKHPSATVQQISEKVWRATIINQSGKVELEEAGELEQGVPESGLMPKLDQDIVVYWRHQQGLPGSIDMVSYKAPGKDRGTFMMTLTPGDELQKLTQGRDWLFVLDFSGSMQGKYHSLIEGVNKGLSQLNPSDRFRIFLFNNSAREITSGYTAASPANVSQFTQSLENLRPEGGTNLYAGLEQAIDVLDADRASAVILVTDGVANVGVTEKKDFLSLLEKADVRLFTFVMGNSANRPLLDGMAKISNGFAMAVSNSDDISGRLILATDKLSHEAFRDIDVKIKGVKTRDIYPQKITSLYHGQQLILVGHYWGSGLAEVSMSGKISGETKTWSTQFEFPNESVLHPELERMWAYASIESMQDAMDYLGQEDADTKQAVIDLALEYSLVTDYTSMLVVREEVFQELGIERKNKQRVETESKAREQRAAQPVRNNRKDEQQPAFNAPRAYPKSGGGGGGGALGPWMLVLFGAGVFLKKRLARTRPEN